MFWTWQRQKRRNCARLLIFQSWQHQKRSNSARRPSKMKSWVQSWRPRTNSFCDFSSPLRLPRKSDARSHEVLHRSRKITLANLKIWCSKMQPILGNQRPDLLTSLVNMSLVLRLPRNASFQILFKCPTPAIVFGNANKPSRFAHFWQGAQSLAPATRNDIWTSKSGANMWCSVHFDFEMCFAYLRATTACTCSTSQLPKLLQRWCALYDFARLTSKCASCYNGFQKCSENGVSCTFWLRNVLRATTACNFVISDLARWLRTRHFSEPTFRPSGATNHWKTEWFATCLPFRAPASSFFGLFLFSDLLAASLLFFDSSHLCFVTCPYSRKFDF